MKTALLICDHVDEDLLHIQGAYADMFKELLSGMGVEVFYVCDGRFPMSVSDYDAYVVNGSRRSVYEKEGWIEQLKGFVRELYFHKKKYVGVCFGHQLLASALGGQVSKAEAGWQVGVHHFTIVKKEKWMAPYESGLRLLMMCQDQVERLPQGAVVLATTPTCPVGMFRVGERMLGIQAHPEFSKEYDRALMELRQHRLGADVFRKGMESLSREVDSALMGGWIRAFLRQ
ncbi:MAG TPA: amidotransferase [Bacteroidetes bacterium]|nr:amidotransferase [Bacteroidota bacterium]